MKRPSSQKPKREKFKFSEENTQPPATLKSIFVALAAVAAAGIMVSVGLEHGAQGYEARREKELKLKKQAKKREQNAKKPPRR